MHAASRRWTVLTGALLVWATAFTSLQAQGKQVLTFEDFSALRAVSDPQLSPDGARVLYAVRTTDVSANRRTTRTFVMPTAGGAARVFPDDRTAASEARWAPDGSKVAYVALGQLWVANADGSDARQLTHLSGGATGPVWSPTGDRIAIVSAVYPECRDDACNAAKAKAVADRAVKAHVTDALMYRHWNAYDDGTRSHLFVVGLAEAPRDLIPGARYDVPPGPFGGSEGYAFAPDGRELAYTAKDQGRADAWTTDNNLYLVPVSGGASTVITAANVGNDQNPVYTADGRFIVYTTVDDAWRPDTVWLHEIGTGVDADVQLFHEPDERYWVGADFTRSDRFLVIGVG